MVSKPNDKQNNLGSGGVLITSIREPQLHPEARLVLEWSKQDFRYTYLWTLADIELAYDTLKGLSLLDYFRLIIGQDRKNRLGAAMVLRIKDGIYNTRNPYDYLEQTDIPKDLRKIGNPEELVLIEDFYSLTELEVNAGIERGLITAEERLGLIGKEIRLGYPPERVVHIPKFNGQPDDSLVEAYTKPLYKFDT